MSESDQMSNQSGKPESKPAAKRSATRKTTSKASVKSKPAPKEKPQTKTTDKAHEQPHVKMPDPVELSQSVAKIAERSQKLILDFMEKRSQSEDAKSTVDPFNIGGAFLELTQRMMADPAYLMKAQAELWQGYMNLWQYTSKRMMGE